MIGQQHAVYSIFSSRHADSNNLFYVLCHMILCEARLSSRVCSIRRRSDYIIGFIAPAIGPNKSRKPTRLIALAHNKRGIVWMKNNIHGFTADNCLFVKPCMLFFIQTLPRILCAGAISRVSFFDLFGPIAGAINPII